MKLDLLDIKSTARYIDPRFYKKLLTEGADEDFYKEFIAERLILRDHLAIDRTMLSNEATFLAYIRTGLAVSAAGATLVHFGQNGLTTIVGVVLIAGGLIVFFVGVGRYRRMKKMIHKIRERHEEHTL